ncbi:hypothetical protein TCAL_01761 [Tigriopus californicus]|uniref:AAA+ ATPase domain-containing protein n=1 Tax=Tigriopus californicus TaxID=6832 RepID=A0A553N838_TIGCA|nr:ATPase WRNIP1-like [Tigriopus californicus]TRY61583.1 hypothetical protein TCAL_01761 [Tigriopus californicus]|eukprot:TCALIF_01761-PA protein Name:"Similar to Wrnip1 ATPase WRNIP1 (Rattus norvegicus)" AED:0.01 eAED:0.01 QI:12/1/1/1/1/1/2/82/487
MSGALSNKAQCPVCFSSFSRHIIASHAAKCGVKPTAGAWSALMRSTAPKRARSNALPDAPAVSETQSASRLNPPALPEKPEKPQSQAVPLAEAMRPQLLSEYVGQTQVLEDGQHLWRTLIERNQMPSVILWGPPGCGKTSLAHVIAQKCKQDPKHRFVKLSACTSNVAEIKEVVKVAKNDWQMTKRKTVLFIDEVHRFNKLQQDAFLPHVENGTITLIGATTENPSFSLNSALLSRCKVIPLEALSTEAVVQILERAKDQCASEFEVGQDCLTYLAQMSNGDARTALNSFQMALDSNAESKIINLDHIKESLRRSHVLYDRKGDEHFHCASALQKSIRGSDANAALYWTMRMLQGGEDPLFIARRLVRISCEDVGLADPSALGMAVSAMQGCQLIGKPECNVILAQCAVYLARAKKSHEVLKAMGQVIQQISNSEGEVLPGVPLHLRNGSNKLAKDLGYGLGYSHDLNKVGHMSYMPEGLEDLNFFS